MDTNTVSTCAGAGGLAGPAITTTPSGSVPVGGSISDSATVIGGAAPTGSVEFKLFGPGDPRARRRSPRGPARCRRQRRRRATSRRRPPARTSGSRPTAATRTTAAAVSHCGSETVQVTSEIMTGRAYGLTATATVLGIPLVNVTPEPRHGRGVDDRVVDHGDAVHGGGTRRGVRARAVRERHDGRARGPLDGERVGQRHRGRARVGARRSRSARCSRRRRRRAPAPPGRRRSPTSRWGRPWSSPSRRTSPRTRRSRSGS